VSNSEIYIVYQIPGSKRAIQANKLFEMFVVIMFVVIMFVVIMIESKDIQRSLYQRNPNTKGQICVLRTTNMCRMLVSAKTDCWSVQRLTELKADHLKLMINQKD
jgi:steroid 5-alpha reductase family enzyme